MGRGITKGLGVYVNRIPTHLFRLCFERCFVACHYIGNGRVMKKFHTKASPNIFEIKRNSCKVTGTLPHGGSHVVSETTRILYKFNSWFQN